MIRPPAVVAPNAELHGTSILSVMGRLPWPIDDGWRMRSANLLRVLAARGAQIDLVTFGDPADAARAPEASVLRSVQCLPRRRTYAVGDLLAGVMWTTPFSVLNYRDRAVANRIRDLSAQAPYDLLLVEDVVMAQYAGDARARVKMLDMHNVESHLMRRYAQQESRIARRWYASLTAPKLARYEARISGAFDTILTCSEPDRARLIELGVRTPIKVVPNGIDPAFFAQTAAQPTDGSIVFVGSMDYHANISGIRFFLREIWPAVRAELPSSVMYIVGKNPPRELVEHGDASVVVTGAVPDVRPFLSRASVVVVPLTVGGGTRLKILEAMAMGKAIVSTSIGCEGLAVQHGRDIAIADAPDEFAREVVRLVRDTGEAGRMAAEARRHVVAQYDWTSIAGEIAVGLGR